MPSHLVERTFPDGLHIPVDAGGAARVHSYVTEDRAKTCCVYDAPDPEAIRRTAARNALPVDSISQVSVLDLYFYR